MAAYRRSGAFSRVLRLAVLGFALSGLAACGHLSGGMMRDRDCLARVMYFESIRSSDEGMLAVGTVVMNRAESNKYPNSVCGVVGQSNQFAPGTLSRSMSPGKSRDRAYRIADQVLRGKRHRGVGKAMFFHTAGRTYGYSNMHYVSVAGGNAFYERSPTPGRAYIPRSVIAQAGPLDSVTAPRWFLGSGYRVVTERPEPEAPAPRPAPTYVAAAPPPQARPAYVDAPIPLVPPTSIEALILASNGT
jgi:Cell Wall Hydrolase